MVLALNLTRDHDALGPAVGVRCVGERVEKRRFIRAPCWQPLHKQCRVERPRLSQVISQLAYVLTSLPAVFALAECLSAAEAEAEEEAEAAAEAAAEEEELLLGCI